MNDDHPVAYHEKLLAGLEEDVKKHDARINALEKAAAVREEQIRNLFIAVGKMEKTAEIIQQAVNDLKQKPAKKWDSFMDTLMKLGLGAIISYLVQQVLTK